MPSVVLFWCHHLLLEKYLFLIYQLLMTVTSHVVAVISRFIVRHAWMFFNLDATLQQQCFYVDCQPIII